MVKWLLGLFFGRFDFQSPLTDEQRQWIDDRFDWLQNEFGIGRLNGEVYLPNEKFFPDPYVPAIDGAESLLNRVCTYMSIDRSRLELKLFTRDTSYSDIKTPSQQFAGAAGVFEPGDSTITIWLEQSMLNNPESLISTIAHELGHVLLLADNRYSRENEDHERLTDLMTVFFGFGVFSANSSLVEENWRVGNVSGWSIGTMGYLSLAEYAYALAVYAFRRNEASPQWLKSLRPDVKKLFRLEYSHLVNGTRPPKPVHSSDESNDAAVADVTQENRAAHALNEHEQSIEPDADDSKSVDDDEQAVSTTVNPESGLNQADDLFAIGVSYQSDQMFQQAIDVFSRALAESPDDPEILLSRAESYCKSGRFVEAIDDCSLALQIDPSPRTTFAHSIRAEAYIWQRRYHEALVDARKAAIAMKKSWISGRYAYAIQLRALAQFGLGNVREALDDVQLAIQDSPKQVGNYLLLSRIYERNGDAKEAATHLAEAIRRDPTLVDVELREKLLTGRPLSEY